MSVISILTRKPPTFGKSPNEITFDAVLEDIIEAETVFTQFPLEIGANASDHGIILPRKYSITAAVSNNPLSPSVTDFVGGFLSNFFADSGIGAAVAGLSAGFLAGSDQTRAGSTLTLLLGIMYQREPFDVDAGDIQLQKMVITNIYRTRRPEIENGLLFTAELMELPLIATVINGQQKTNPGTGTEATQAAEKSEKGEVFGIPVSDSVRSKIARAFPGVG